MSVYFIFSDESGDYKKERTDDFIQSQPYYCRSSIILEAGNWKPLINNLCALKADLLKIDPDKEVKWNYLWSLFKYKKNKKEIPKTAPFYFLRNHSLELLLLFIEESLKLLAQCDDCYLIYTITLNERGRTEDFPEEYMLQMHMQDMMQRVEMQVQSEANNLCVLFFDSKGKKLDKKLKEAYHLIYQQGDFIQKYNHIVDSLFVDFSHHNIGIQLADYCAGIFNAALRSHKNSVGIFKNLLWQKVRRFKGNVFGYGICEIPTNKQNRIWLKEKISSIIK